MDKFLKKIIILTENFNPTNSAGANRPSAWARYLYKKGYYPVVFTRNVINDSDHFIEKNLFYEVHYIKLRDNILKRYREKYAGSIFGKFCGLGDILTNNFQYFCSMRSVIKPVLDYIAVANVSGMIATGPRFSIFGIANTISKIAKLKWIADYRDDWTTSEIAVGLHRITNLVEKGTEIRYLKNALAFTTVSPWYLEKISRTIKIQGYLVENGFEPNPFTSDSISESNIYEDFIGSDKFLILYPGTLYSTQKLTYMASVLDKIDKETIKCLVFVIVGMNSLEVIRQNPTLKKYLGSTLIILNRLDKSKADFLIQRADAVIYIAHIDRNNMPIKGIPSSKLYDYIKYQKKVLMCPSDSDFAEFKLKECDLAIVEQTSDEMAHRLSLEINNRDKASRNKNIIPEKIYLQNSREYTVTKLATVFDKHFD